MLDIEQNAGRICDNFNMDDLPQEIEMHRNPIETNRNPFGSAKAAWSKVDDHDLYVIAGNRVRPAGKSQETHWISKDEVEKLLAEWQACQKDIGCPAF